jgi:dTDP-4-amino-4,6-dideoxygalactose transaminase
MVDVDYESFNVSVKNIATGLSSRTKAVMPVHLFGQSCDMEPIIDFAGRHGIFVIEDNAQSIGACYTFSDGKVKQAGTMGDTGCVSFFPSKNLSCYGDGGAIMADDETMAEKLKMIANHGQAAKYYHDVLGCNSRLDTVQAAVLNVKLKYLGQYTQARHAAARRYHELLAGIEDIALPVEMPYSTHVYHQFTIKVERGSRNELQAYLKTKGIPSMVYYPLAMHKQNAFKHICRQGEDLKISEKLSQTVLSLPIHTELTEAEQVYISGQIRNFFKNK